MIDAAPETTKPEEIVPGDEREAAEAVRAALAEGAALALRGEDSRAEMGRPVTARRMLRTKNLSGIVFYEPEELVFSAHAGTPLAEIEAMLAESDQMLAFEPPDLSLLLGHPAPRRGTLGGMTAAGLAGPRRVKVGGVRDHLLGFRAVNGHGEIYKSGGRVVKNVTGYDLSKLVCGSWGTLSLLTTLTFKVLPAPERGVTLLWEGLDEERAQALMTTALKSPMEVSAACHLPSDVDAPEAARRREAIARTALRVEGFSASVTARARALRMRLKAFGAPRELEGESSLAFWRAVRDVAPLWRFSDRFVWRVGVPPAHGARTAARLRAALPEARLFLDWGGGLIWLAAPAVKTPEAGDAQAEAVRACLKEGGHATLVRAPAALRARMAVFHPQPAPLARLRERLRASFDPAGVLEPGRMYPLPGDMRERRERAIRNEG